MKLTVQIVINLLLFATLIALVILLQSVWNGSSDSIRYQHSYSSRRLSGENAMPARNREYHFPAKRVTDITNSAVLNTIKKTISSGDRGDVLSSYSNISTAVDDLREKMSWDEKTGLIRNDEPVRTILSNGVTNYFFKLRAAKGNSKHHKDLEEVVFSRVIQEDILPKLLPEMIDIVITTGSKSLDMLFLEDWKEFIIGMHCIIIQEGDPERSIAIPNWLNYELYTSKDVRRAVGDLEWLFDLDEDGQKGDSSGVSSAANFGFLVSDRDYIFLLNRHTPISAVSKENEKNELSVLLQHVDNLIMPSAPYYFNTFFDDYKHSGEMPSGYPHSLRDGVETALSHGVVDVSCDYDAAATIFKGHTEETYARVPQEDTRRQLRDTPAVTIPARSLFSLSLQNLAFSRNLLGPAFFLLGSPSASLLKKYPHKRVDHHLHQQIYQQITGWMLKVICDQLGIGVKAFKLHRSDSVADSIIGKSDIPCIHREDAFARLKGDLIWDDKAEEVVRWFSSITLSKVGNVAKASNELLDLMERDLVNIHPVFREIVEMKRAYTVLYEKRNIFNINEYIDFRASRSSYGPKATIYDDVLLKKAKEETEDESPPPFRSRQQGAHQCAIFTIVRNDTEMLSWFTRYYSQHFPTKDIYVLNHNPTTPDTFLYPGSDNISMKTVFSGDRRFIRVINLYGDAAGFPFYYFVSYADKYQRRLFRWGYQCVILADVDEIAVVNAEVYPQGLAEYLSNWVFNTTQNYIRADGRSIAHISEPDDTVDKSKAYENVESPVMFNTSIMAIRNYWISTPKYSKPILSRRPARHKAGFHGYYLPHQADVDGDLKLVHLKEFDRTICMERELYKFNLAKQSHQSEIDKAFNIHIHQYEQNLKRGKVCQFALGCYATKYDKVFDNTGTIALEKIPEKFKLLPV